MHIEIRFFLISCHIYFYQKMKYMIENYFAFGQRDLDQMDPKLKAKIRRLLKEHMYIFFSFSVQYCHSSEMVKVGLPLDGIFQKFRKFSKLQKISDTKNGIKFTLIVKLVHLYFINATVEKKTQTWATIGQWCITVLAPSSIVLYDAVHHQAAICRVSGGKLVHTTKITTLY